MPSHKVENKNYHVRSIVTASSLPNAGFSPPFSSPVIILLHPLRRLTRKIWTRDTHHNEQHLMNKTNLPMKNLFGAHFKTTSSESLNHSSAFFQVNVMSPALLSHYRWLKLVSLWCNVVWCNAIISTIDHVLIVRESVMTAWDGEPYWYVEIRLEAYIDVWQGIPGYSNSRMYEHAWHAQKYSQHIPILVHSVRLAIGFRPHLEPIEHYLKSSFNFGCRYWSLMTHTICWLLI